MTDTRFVVAAHLLGYLAWVQSQEDRRNSWIGSSELSRSINTHSVVVRRVLNALKGAGFIETRRGKEGGSRLAVPADSINLRGVYEAACGDCDSVSIIGLGNPSLSGQCDVGPHIEHVLHEIVKNSEQALFAELERTSVAEFSERVIQRIFQKRSK